MTLGKRMECGDNGKCKGDESFVSLFYGKSRVQNEWGANPEFAVHLTPSAFTSDQLL
jgi:hypothetical protein